MSNTTNTTNPTNTKKVIYCGLFVQPEDTEVLTAETKKHKSYDTWFNHHATLSYLANKSDEEIKQDKSWAWVQENLGDEVEVLIWRLYGDEKGACFTLCPYQLQDVPYFLIKKNLHITSGTQAGTRPSYSNSLLDNFIHTLDIQEYTRKTSKLLIKQDLYIKLKLKVGYFASDQKVHYS